MTANGNYFSPGRGDGRGEESDERGRLRQERESKIIHVKTHDISILQTF